MTLRPIRLLIADDERDLVEVLADRLAATGGFLVAKAYDGREAIEVARSFLPSVILIDRVMPVLDGWEACRRLRADPATCGAGIVIMSAEIAHSSDELAREAGADLFLPKPYDEQALIGLLEAVAPL